MRSALWETSPGQLIGLLNSGAPLQRADLYSISLGNGTVLRWSGCDIPIRNTVGTQWVVGPGFSRGMARFTTGISVDDILVTMTDIEGTQINGQGLVAFARAGGLIGARMQVDRAFWEFGDNTPVGAFYWFAGRLAGVSGDRYHADLVVRSDLDRLNINIPREVYQAQCRNTVFDSACTLRTTDFTVTSAATSDSAPNRLTFNVSLSQADDYFALGQITMTSGNCAGISRSVMTYQSNVMKVINAWPFPISSGDTFTVIPGCDGLQSTCQVKFNNVIHFRGFPYIPQASLMLPGGPS